MKRIAIGMLALFLSWNVVLGVLGEGILCLHEGLDAHFESGTKERILCEVESSAAALTLDTCPPCIDLVISSSDFASVRVTERVAPTAPLLFEFAASGADGSIPALNRLVGSMVCPRAPPQSGSLSLRVVRTQVLRV